VSEFFARWLPDASPPRRAACTPVVRASISGEGGGA
jgi:hypothetical protein